MYVARSCMQTILLYPSILVFKMLLVDRHAQQWLDAVRDAMAGRSDHKEACLQMKGGQMRARPLMTQAMPWGEATRVGPSCVPNSATAAAKTMPCITALQSC